MSCPDDALWVAYTDGELEPGEVRPAEAHLVGCERCRARVVALQGEARLLADLLLDRPTLAPVAAPDSAPAHGLAVGLPLAITLAAGLVLAAGTLLETALPAGARWLSPSRLYGVNEMIFDLIFAIRDRAPGLLEFSLAVAATASLAALATFAASAVARRLGGRLALGVLVLALAGVAAPARAALDVRRGESVRVADGEVLHGTLVARGDLVAIDGVVEGNVLAFTEELEVRGEVRGNVIAFAHEIAVSGVVDGVLLAGSRDVRLSGRVGGLVVSASDHFSLAPEGGVEGDLASFGDDVEVLGRVGRDWLVAAHRARLAGRVERDLEAFADRVRIDASARVGGDLRAHVEQESDLQLAPGARIAGASEALLVERPAEGFLQRIRHASFYGWILVRLAAAFAVGLMAYALLPGLFQGRVPRARDFFLSLGKGFAALLVAPAAIVLLALSLVGIPAALLVAMLLLVALYLAGILVAAEIGQTLLPRRSPALRDFGLSLLAGLVVLGVASVVPGLGGVLRVVVALAGLGLLLERATVLWRQSRAGV